MDGPSCAWRQAAIGALEAAGVAYRLLVVSRSRAAVAPIVEAGLAVTVLARDAIGENFRMLGEADGLPPLLMPTRIGIVRSPALATREAKALAEVIRSLSAPQRGTAAALAA